ncbi:competence protein comec, putative, partial [Entamoeba invadens IP1]
KRVLAEYCAHLITPPDVDSTVDIIGVNANGVLDNSQVLTGDHRSEQYPPSENDYTIALRIQFGDFVYFTAGDLDGEDSKSSYKYKYHNVESTYKTFIGQVDVYHADHHGSEHSNNKDFLSTLLPTVSLISCGAGNSYGHPTQKALENMQLTSKIFLTQDCNPTITDKYPNAVIVLNDEIVVSYTKDSSTYTVSDSQNSKSHTFAIKSNKPKPEVCN